MTARACEYKTGINSGVYMKKKTGRIGSTWKSIMAVLLVLTSFLSYGTEVFATADEIPATGPDWSIDNSAAPAITAESAILLDVDTGVILYEKNVHAMQYPASITKILTCLIARENSELTDIVTFSHEAVFGIERGSNNIGIDEGEQLSMKDCLYATLLESANEVAAGIAEHVGGSAEGFSELMNEKVQELGGTDSHFVNANGLPDENHYTSAYDMGLIGREFFRDELLTEISGTVFYHISSSPTQKDEIDLRNHHRMLPGCQLSRRQTYEYTIGGKTGFTTVARQTLVTCAKKDGHKLLCVILKDETPNHYKNTISLFDYGFACYDKPEVRAQIDAKAEEIAAQEAEKEQERLAAEEAQRREEERAEQERLAEQEAEKEEANLIEDTAEKEKQTKEKSSFSIMKLLMIVVALVVIGAVSTCGFFLYKAYCREQERRRRQAEIMARHRERKKQYEKNGY